MNCKFMAVATVALLALGGCATTLQPGALNDKGRFETTSLPYASDVKVNKPFDKARYGKLVYVVSDQKTKKLDDFFIQSIKNMHAFDTVATKDDLEKMVIEKHLESSVTGISDNMIGLHNLAKAIGPFLVVKPTVEWNGGYNFEASLTAIDPETTETEFSIKKKAFNWSGLDQPLFYPLLNGLLDWTAGRTVATAPDPTPDASTKKP